MSHKRLLLFACRKRTQFCHFRNVLQQATIFKDDEFEVATATTIEEAKELLAVGFDYVTEKNDIMLFRRPKRFGV
ncbi:MAG: hypothetical protein ACETVQ_00275 [Candidatus Bathyarchaeia archaeon]